MPLTQDEYYEAIVLAIAGTMTERTLANLRHVLETNYVRSTVEGASEAERALYTPESIAKCEFIAMQDNALSIARWARAICLAVNNQKEHLNAITAAQRTVEDATHTVNSLRTQLEGIQTGRTFPTLSTEERVSQAQTTAQALQRAKEDLSRKTSDLLHLSNHHQPEEGAQDLGHSPHQGEREISIGRIDLDAGVPPVP